MIASLLHHVASGKRIYAGFAIVITAMVALTIYLAASLQSVGDYHDEYEELAEDKRVLSLIQFNLQAQQERVERWLYTQSARDWEQVEHFRAAADEHLATAEGLYDQQWRAEALEHLVAMERAYREMTGDARTLSDQAETHRERYREASAALLDVLATVEAAGDEEASVELEEAASMGRQRLRELQTEFLRYLDERSETSIASTRRRLGALRTALDDLAGTDTTAFAAEDRQELRAAFERMDEAISTMLETMEAREHRIETHLRPAAEEIGALLWAMHSHLDQRGAEVADDFQHLVREMVRTGSLFAAGVILLTLMIAGIVGRSMLQPLESLRNSLGRLSDGDLGISIPHTLGRDAIGDLARGLETYRDSEIRQRQLETERERDRVLRDIGEHLDIALWIRARERVIYINPAYERIFGRDRESLYRSPDDWLRAVHPEDAETVERAHRDAVKAGSTFDLEYRIVTPQGSVRWVHAHQRPIPASEATDGDAREERWVGVLEDVTDRKTAERELAEANRVKDDFLAAVSHDLRTPLNAIVGFTDLLAASELSTEQRRYLELCRSASDNLLALIDTLLDLARLEAGRAILESREFELRQVLREQIELVGTRDDARNLELRLDVAGDVPEWVCGDPARLGQVVSNLLVNAAKFTSAGFVSLTVHRGDGGELQFTVRDTGEGIPEHEQSRIFEPFSQGKGVAARLGGSGLGLKICAEIVRLMDGRIWLESAPGWGTAFHFVVRQPAADPPGSEAPGTTSQGEGEDEPPTPRPGVGVLVAEDEATNALLVRTLLEQMGCEPTLVTDGRQALEAWRQGTYEVLLVDIQMPELDGVEVTREIRRTERLENRRHTPIVVLSAHAVENVQQRCSDAGCDAYLTKPLRCDELQRTIAKLTS